MISERMSMLMSVTESALIGIHASQALDRVHAAFGNGHTPFTQVPIALRPYEVFRFRIFQEDPTGQRRRTHVVAVVRRTKVTQEPSQFD